MQYNIVCVNQAYHSSNEKSQKWKSPFKGLFVTFPIRMGRKVGEAIVRSIADF